MSKKQAETIEQQIESAAQQISVGTYAVDLVSMEVATKVFTEAFPPEQAIPVLALVSLLNQQNRYISQLRNEIAQIERKVRHSK